MEKYRFGFTSLCIGFYKYFSPNPNILYTIKQNAFAEYQILYIMKQNAFAEIPIFYAQ